MNFLSISPAGIPFGSRFCTNNPPSSSQAFVGTANKRQSRDRGVRDEGGDRQGVEKHSAQYVSHDPTHFSQGL